jgi:hypothetical protein
MAPVTPARDRGIRRNNIHDAAERRRQLVTMMKGSATGTT